MMKSNRLKIMITGFYGAENSGDEAMLRNFVFKVRERVPDAIILVASDKVSQWQHDDVYFISPLDRAQLKETDIFVVGGGDLGVGFGWNLLPYAKKFNNRCVMMSSGINDSWTDNCVKDVVRPMLKLFDKIFVRDMRSAQILNDWDVFNQLTTDMAIGLNETEIDFRKSEKHVVLCIRETEDRQEPRMLDFAIRVLRKITEDGFTITILPLCKEDWIKSDKLSGFFGGNVQVVFSQDSQQHKYVIRNSNYLVSLGRLHSLIYAVDTCTPMLSINHPCAPIIGYSKIEAWMDYINMKELYMDFTSSIKKFSLKWNYMRSHANGIKEILELQKLKHRQFNDKQFDEILEGVL